MWDMFSKRRTYHRDAKKSRRTGARKRSGRRTLSGFEQLEERQLLTSVPFGALAMDTGEFMLGDVLVTVVLMESSDRISAVNPNTENWRPETIAAAKSKVVEGIRWWEQTLATQFPANTAPLNFHFDFTHADVPVLTDYEPIANPSTHFQFWIRDFLSLVGHHTTGDFSRDIRAFNHQQRQTHGTDWAFTVFVVNDENDADGMFEPGGFSRAFAFAGGRFFVSPAGRPPSTFAHETGHMFWALDEYPGVSSYYAQRGYYNTQNLNAVNQNPIPTSVFVTIQPDSIMSKDYTRQELVNLTGGQWQQSSGRPVLTWAWERNTSAVSTLAMIGWQDTSGNGIFDVLDVPFSLTGSGFLDAHANVYRFVGSSAVQTLPNRNSSGLQSDITINRIRRAEYRIDDGPWQTAATYDAFRVNLDLRIAVPGGEAQSIQIRTVDDRTGVASPIFSGSTAQPAALEKPGINGFVWDDRNDDGLFDYGERPISGWTVRLIDDSDQPLNWMHRVEPDDHPNNARLDNVEPSVTLRALLYGASQGVVSSTSTTSSTGTRVFGYLPHSLATKGVIDWDSNSQLRADFQSPVAVVRLDAIAVSWTAAARLEAYDAKGVLLQRYTTPELNAGFAQTMKIKRPVADIAYVVVRQHGDSQIQLDNFHFGINTQTVTDQSGAYHLSGLPEGTYRVQVVAPPKASPVTQVHSVTIAGGEGEGQVASGIDFAARAPAWQNSVDRHDVLANGYVTPQDVLVLINYINAHPDRVAIDQSQHTPPPYYDVDGDGNVTAIDVLAVINRLNLPRPSDDDSPVFDVSGGRGGFAQGEGEATSIEAWWFGPAQDRPSSETANNSADWVKVESLPAIPEPAADSQTRDVYFRTLASGFREEPGRRPSPPEVVRNAWKGSEILDSPDDLETLLGMWV
jgi:hypothetical protein